MNAFNQPTAAREPSRRADVDAIDDDVTLALVILREELQPKDGSRAETALCALEMYHAVVVRILRKTNPSKIRSEARTVEIQARMDGKPECLGSLHADYHAAD